MYEKVDIVVFYGGAFKKYDGQIHYVDGDSVELQGLDIDKICFFLVIGFARDLNYPGKVFMYYRAPNMNLTDGLHLIMDDVSTNKMIKYLENCGRMEVYMSHDSVIDAAVYGNVGTTRGGLQANVTENPDFLLTMAGDGNVGTTRGGFEGTEMARDDNVGIMIPGLAGTEMEGDSSLGCLRAGLVGTEIAGAVIEGAEIERADIENANAGAGIEIANAGAEIDGSEEEGAEIEGSEIEGSEIEGSEVEGVDIEYAGAEIEEAEISGAGIQIAGACNVEEDSTSESSSEYREILPTEGNDEQVRSDVEHMSDYYESSDPGSFYSSNSDNERDPAARRKSRFPSYNVRGGMIANFELGMIFEGPKQFRQAITSYSVAVNRELYYAKNENTRIRVKCAGKNCPWTVFASVDGTNKSLQVKTCINEHNCNTCFKNKRVTSTFLATHFKDRIQNFPTVKLLQLQRFCKSELRVDVSLNQCRRAKEKVMKDINGSYIKEYARLWDYAEELRNTNQGSTVVITTERSGMGSQQTFQRFYLCFDSLKKGWLTGCRRIIGLDGCFLKGFCKGELLAAVGRDANNQMFPIAWAVVEGENKSSWKWFLELLMQDLGYVNGLGLTLISDKQKGLVYAISELLPHVEHRMCARHIYANWSKEHRGTELKLLFWKLAKSRTRAEFDVALSEMQLISPVAAEDVQKNGPSQWCRAFFSDHTKCDIVDNNLSETFNSWILEARSKAIESMLEDIRLAIMKRIQQKRDVAASWSCLFGPRIMKMLNKNKEEACNCEVIWNGSDGYEIKHRGDTFVVHLGSFQCSCREWDLTGIPCPHGVSAITHKGHVVEDYVDICYSKETYLKGYQYPLQPVKGPNHRRRTGLEELLPPEIKKMPSRPKKSRRKDPSESKKVGKLTRNGRIMTCSVCHERCHNRQGCKKSGKSGGQAKESAVSEIGHHSRSDDPTGNSGTRKRGSGRGTMQGIGLYTNENSGLTILNPGRLSSRLISSGRKRQRGNSGTNHNQTPSMHSTQGSVNQ